ncbi:MAG: hypothetical protein LUH14_06910 [Clostridiaceae bacterium]|nr:hypothetical protein [Clostridiaceae bacterium]
MDLTEEELQNGEAVPAFEQNQEIADGPCEEEAAVFEQNQAAESMTQESVHWAEFAAQEESQQERTMVPPGTPEESAAPANMEQVLKELVEKIEVVAKNQDRNDRQIAQTLRENANFQIQVRQGMQKELEDYKKIERKEVFVPVLRELAMTYVGYKSSLTQKIDELLAGADSDKKDLTAQIGQLQQIADAMFDELQEILEDNGAEIVNSSPGELRKARQCKIMRKIPTGDQNLHNTIARSTRDGVVLGRQVLCNEYVDVYVYDKTMGERRETGLGTAEDKNQETGFGSAEDANQETGPGTAEDKNQENAVL